MSQETDYVGVYYANQPLGNLPEYSVTREQAREWVNSYLAKWVNKAKAIQMNHTMAAMHRTAQSLTMGARVAEMAADGKLYYQIMVNAYRPADRIY